MKLSNLFLASALCLALVSCSSNKAKTTENMHSAGTETGAITSEAGQNATAASRSASEQSEQKTKKASRAYLDQAHNELGELENRLIALRNVAITSWRKYHGSHKNLHKFVDAEFVKLGAAKADLELLGKADGRMAPVIQSRLSKNLSALRADLDGADSSLHLAE